MTTKLTIPALDALHGGMILAALALAYYVPFELVLLSYAILGPLHYLTEISWLHERSYFMSRRYLAWFLVLCTILLFGLRTHTMTVGVIFCLALAFSAAFALSSTFRGRVIVLMLGFAAALLMAYIPSLNTPLVILLPTVIHVSLFTLLFMLVGAMRVKSASQLLLVLLYLSSIALIMIHPPAADVRFPELAAGGPKFFGDIADAFSRIFGQAWPFDARLAGFLSFIYTYHYLNWFIKVKVIKWNSVSRERMLVILIVGAGVTSFYFINYTLGFLVLLSLSLLHVVLEFPLNVISIRDLGRMIMPRASSP